ncbi:uncharacterized protein METZ01_LOCUS297856 [marine metagenome]|uniref:Uncharacterized protein n=1 Tax=marine metagenome TaxID=408172 RepID=A0A382MC34_9ZZZZ
MGQAQEQHITMFEFGYGTKLEQCRLTQIWVNAVDKFSREAFRGDLFDLAFWMKQEQSQ